MIYSIEDSLGSLFTEFYTKEELQNLKDEINAKSRSLQSSGFEALQYIPGPSDPLLRISHICIVAKFPSLPFFTAKIRNTISKQQIEILRSIQFHPEEGWECIYLEAPLSSREVWNGLVLNWREDYQRIISLVQNFKLFIEQEFHFNTEDEEKELFQWLIQKAIVWEGAIIEKGNTKVEFGEVTSSEARIWFQSLSKAGFSAKDLRTPSFLGDGGLFAFAFLHANGQKILLSGSFNEYAKGQALTEIPYYRKKFYQFLKTKGIEALSGLGRSSRMMFNYLPTEMIFLFPSELYPDLHNSFMEQNLRIQLSSMHLQFAPTWGLITIFVPDRLWQDSIWRDADHTIKNIFPAALYKQTEVLRGKSVEAFLIIEADDMTAIRLFDLASRLEQSFLPWEDRIREKISEKPELHGKCDSIVFSEAYIANHTPEQALIDLFHLPTKDKPFPIYFTFEDKEFRSHCLLPKGKITLSTWIKIWNALDLYPLSQTVSIWEREEGNLEKIFFTFPGTISSNFAQKLEQIIPHILLGHVLIDPVLALISKSNIEARAIPFFIAIRDYLLQVKSSWSIKEVTDVILKLPQFSEKLYECFQSRFEFGKISDPKELEELTKLGQTVREDEILQALASLPFSIVRTNFYGIKSSPEVSYSRPFLAFKINSIMVKGIPKPVPYREIFVYAPRFQGVHLRGGKVSRGGLRFSDRPNDYRTEVLSLWKTQTVKNSLIVPVGSKGCFVRTPHSLEEEEFSYIDAYKGYVRGMLELTDSKQGNLDIPFAGDKIPYAYEDLDPYLVVAADKGTAALSDVANSLSEEKNYWLGDAFASGGSKGYSHKDMGITAKGALRTADRNLCELQLDFYRDEVTVVGIGDLGGDVFGNGLIESDKFRLVAAFNHKHIFLDPNPKTEIAAVERKRLFAIGGAKAGWDAYNQELISEGGGIFLRNEKRISLSKEVRLTLGISQESLSGSELVKAILMSPVDLLYNGGIGTYIKASSEEHNQVGDPTNNEVRIDASQVRVRVVSEGGNLGLTQKARLELADKGVLLFTDALDNSAGVDLSDHEVNLKILLKDDPKRDSILLSIASNVAEDVLRDNSSQSLAVILDRYESRNKGLDHYLVSIRILQKTGNINLSEQFIPQSSEEWESWRENGIPSPILCVLLSHTKMVIYKTLLESEEFRVDDWKDSYYGYFPESLRQTHSNEMDKHPLAKEITATRLTNYFVDCFGSSTLELVGEDDWNNRLFRIVRDFVDKSLPKIWDTLVANRNLHQLEYIRDAGLILREKLRSEYGKEHKRDIPRELVQLLPNPLYQKFVAFATGQKV